MTILEFKTAYLEIYIRIEFETAYREIYIRIVISKHIARWKSFLIRDKEKDT